MVLKRPLWVICDRAIRLQPRPMSAVHPTTDIRQRRFGLAKAIPAREKSVKAAAVVYMQATGHQGWTQAGVTAA